MPGRGQESSLLIKSSIESSIERGGLYLGISTSRLYECYKPNQHGHIFTHEDIVFARRGNLEYPFVRVGKSERFPGCGAQGAGLKQRTRVSSGFR
jgi:hypothetical protein